MQLFARGMCHAGILVYSPGVVKKAGRYFALAAEGGAGLLPANHLPGIVNRHQQTAVVALAAVPYCSNAT
ncbi:MAG: hypothetical protein GQ542_08280 [Desulforhopalus sp.]|nr:hypothetical protein [Desulforhopalus sp.]